MDRPSASEPTSGTQPTTEDGWTVVTHRKPRKPAKAAAQQQPPKNNKPGKAAHQQPKNNNPAANKAAHQQQQFKNNKPAPITTSKQKGWPKPPAGCSLKNWWYDRHWGWFYVYEAEQDEWWTYIVLPEVYNDGHPPGYYGTEPEVWRVFYKGPEKPEVDDEKEVYW